MLIPSPEEFDAITRIDLNVFVERVFVELKGATPYLDNFHIAVICAELEAAFRGERRRLAIAVPPRSLKSVITSIAYPAWLLGHNPHLEIVCASYGQVLSDHFAKDCRQVMMSDWYRRLFPATRLVSERPALAALETTAGGGRRATSVGGAITGFGADYLIIDDPTKPEEAASAVERVTANDWLTSTTYNRLDNKAAGVIIVVMQRLHEDDMIGRFDTICDLKLLSFPAIAQQDEHYVIRNYCGVREHRRVAGEALHPERESLAILAEVERALGSQAFATQYLQMPAPPGGSIVKADWFNRFELANPPEFDEVIQSWDTASKTSELSDYSVCTTWGRKGTQLFLLHVLRKKLIYPDLKQAVKDQAVWFGAKTILIEDSAAGTALIQELGGEGFAVKAVKPLKEKVMRLRAQSARIENGQVFIPYSAPWLDEYLHELSMFPTGRHDDQVDSTSQALAHISTPEPIAAAWLWDLICMEKAKMLEGMVKANHPVKEQEARLSTGRHLERDRDGFYYFTPNEWIGLPQNWGFVKVDA